MKIIIRETGKQETLKLIDPRSGIYWTLDFISDGLMYFDYDQDRNAYICDRKTFEWWSKVINDKQALDQRIHDLINEHGDQKVMDVIEYAGRTYFADLDEEAAVINTELNKVFGE